VHDLTIPRLNANDDTCRLIEWSLADGAKVGEQDVVAIVETSKAAADLYADVSGILQATVTAGAECRVGDVIGHVFVTEQERQGFLRDCQAARPPHGTAPEAGTLIVTERARELAGSSGITEDRLRALGKRIIQRADVEALLAGERSGSPSMALSERQWAIGEIVSHSHKTVPSAFVSMKVHCDALLAQLREWNAEHGQAVGIPEAAIRILAGLRASFPAFFGRLQGNRRLSLPGSETNIGITVDVGTGLFVPVVKDAGSLSVSQIADRLTEFRVTALRDSFRAEDLSGGHLSVSLHTDTDVLSAIPLILVPQVCMVSLPSVQTELVLDQGDTPGNPGRIRQRGFLAIGLAYDHRVINGRDAVAFLKAFKAAAERPESVAL
jgi:2-oxoglutarate dehydrogenase E2 component (dihydrolipoamide succinyltransferase)